MIEKLENLIGNKPERIPPEFELGNFHFILQTIYRLRSETMMMFWCFVHCSSFCVCECICAVVLQYFLRTLLMSYLLCTILSTITLWVAQVKGHFEVSRNQTVKSLWRQCLNKGKRGEISKFVYFGRSIIIYNNLVFFCGLILSIYLNSLAFVGGQMLSEISKYQTLKAS